MNVLAQTVAVAVNIPSWVWQIVGSFVFALVAALGARSVKTIDDKQAKCEVETKELSERLRLVENQVTRLIAMDESSERHQAAGEPQ